MPVKKTPVKKTNIPLTTVNTLTLVTLIIFKPHLVIFLQKIMGVSNAIPFIEGTIYTLITTVVILSRRLIALGFKKLFEYVFPWQTQFTGIETTVNNLSGNINNLSLEVGHVKTKVKDMEDTLWREIKNVGNQVTDVRESVAMVEGSVAGVKDSVAGVKDSVAGVKESVTGVKDSVAGVKATVTELGDNVVRLSDKILSMECNKEAEERYHYELIDVRIANLKYLGTLDEGLKEYAIIKTTSFINYVKKIHKSRFYKRDQDERKIRNPDLHYETLKEDFYSDMMSSDREGSHLVDEEYIIRLDEALKLGYADYIICLENIIKSTDNFKHTRFQEKSVEFLTEMFTAMHRVFVDYIRERDRV